MRRRRSDYAAPAPFTSPGHYRMRGFATIHTQESYDAWMEEEQSYLGDEGEDDFRG